MKNINTLCTEHLEFKAHVPNVLQKFTSLLSQLRERIFQRKVSVNTALYSEGQSEIFNNVTLSDRNFNLCLKTQLGLCHLTNEINPIGVQRTEI